VQITLHQIINTINQPNITSLYSSARETILKSKLRQRNLLFEQ